MIEDNGVGTDHIQYGFGLNSMKERLRSLNGRLQLDSSKSFGNNGNMSNSISEV